MIATGLSAGAHVERPMRDYGRLESTACSRDRAAITALVVGAGALGNEVIKNLALIGVRRLVIVDRDVVEASNLTRSILYCTPDVDRHIRERTPKARLAAERAREINPDVAAVACVGEIADIGSGVLRRADVILSCLDNEMARLELGWICSRLDKPLVDGGLGLLNSSSGQVSIFPGSRGPCYACRKSAERRRTLLNDLQGREDPCWRKQRRPDDAGVSTTPLMASVVAALQVEIALRRIEVDSPLGIAHRITLHPGPALETARFACSRTCPLHEPESIMSEIRECAGRSDAWTPADVLRFADAADGFIALDWPITARASCRTCDHEWEPMLRRARFRHGRCPACGDADPAELEVLDAIGLDSRFADRPLTGLGLPRAHIHEVVQRRDGAHVRRHVEMTGDLGAEAGDR